MPENSSLYHKNGASMKHYSIAGHRVSICFQDINADSALLHNFEPFLCDNSQPPLLTVTVTSHLQEETNSTEVGQFDVGGSNHGVYRTKEGGYMFKIYDISEHLCATMHTSADFCQCSVTLHKGTHNQQHYGLNNCMMMAYAFATVAMDTVLIHSSVIRCNGKGYLMTAPSGTGKSTHTHLWYTTIPGCDLMNDDNPIIRIVDGSPIVYGSPWSGKTPCYRNIQAPIGGIVRIQQSPENTIRRLKPLEAFVMLLPACSNMKWDARIYNGICDSITKFIQTCGIWELGCLPNSEAAILCHDTISKEIHT